MQSVLLYKVALLVLLAGASGTTATVAFYYRGRENDLGSQVANLGTRNDSQNSEISSLKRELDNLTGQISQLNIQIGQLNTANFQLGNLIAQLRAQLANGLCSSGRTVTIGELVDLSSALSTQGVRAKDASLLATNDINSFLSTAGCNLRFAVAVDDYQLDNSIALSELQSLAAAGVQVVVGPLNSGAAQYLLSYANSNHIVLISPSSTSRVLAIPNDYLFRTAPNDGVQGLADARMMIDRGATALIIVQRHDSYGDTLANATAKNFEALGGVVGATIQYDASGGTGFDFTSVLQTLNNDFQTANTGAYANKVAMDFISFEEFGQLIIQANAKYPALLNGPLPWFGTDGDAQDTVISGNATAGPLA